MKPLTTYQVLTLMISFAMLVLMIVSFKNKK
ncbi:putative holin-like toxin [Sporolactobacillus laevolacticus]